jgi:hypothetical protein
MEKLMFISIIIKLELGEQAKHSIK